jgi:hypothetical protein
MVNIDETHWKIVAGGFLIWGIKAAESASCLINNTAKEGVTVMAGITTASNKSNSL